MIINQLLPTLHDGDAIGDEARHLKQFFEAAGARSFIYVLESDPGLESEVMPFDQFLKNDHEGSLTIYHFGLPSVMTEAFCSLAGGKVIIYHNITPAHFFQKYSHEMVCLANEGRRQLQSMAPCTDLALADSEFNKMELDDLGFRATGVLPLFLDFGRYETPPSPLLMNMMSRDPSDIILFVGRVYPNKKIEDLIKAYAYYRSFVNPASRLIIAGRSACLPRYYYPLLRLTSELGLSTEEVWFTDYIPFPELLALYQRADLFLSMSEHEGFCVPLLESMMFGLPILAYKAGAVPETLGDGGLLFDRKDLCRIGEAMDAMIRDRPLRARLREAQKRRLRDFTRDAVEIPLRAYLRPWLSG